MDDKKLLFIVNPRAGKTKSLAPLFDAAAIYSEAGYLVSVRKTTHRGEATELAESLGPEFDVVVCHGGDGTLNETVNGVMRIPREYRPLVSYLPGGSTNDFAASLNISSNPAEAAASAMRMKPRSLDVGKFGETLSTSRRSARSRKRPTPSSRISRICSGTLPTYSRASRISTRSARTA